MIEGTVVMSPDVEEQSPAPEPVKEDAGTEDPFARTAVIEPPHADSADDTTGSQPEPEESSGVIDGTVVIERPESNEAADEGVFDRTAVIEGQHQVKPESADSVASGTVVVSDSPDENAVDGTVVADIDTGQGSTHNFSQTMGMRGLTKEEQEQYEAELAEKSKSAPGELQNV